MYDFVRVASVVPKMKVADVEFNTKEIVGRVAEIAKKNVDVAVFPELCLTGYTCGDLFFHHTLISGVLKALKDVLTASKKYNQTVIVGAPILILGELYNCAVVICEGRVSGIVPKTFIPDHNEFNEKRWFSSSINLRVNEISSKILGLEEEYTISVGRNLIFDIANKVKFGIEICQDLWMSVSPSSYLALNGAELILNISASNETAQKRAYRRELVKAKSASSVCGYVFTSSGANESTTDLVFSGHTLFSENGTLIAENEMIADSDYVMIQDIDIGKVKADRMTNKSFSDCALVFGKNESAVFVGLPTKIKSDATLYNVSKTPFIPDKKQERLSYCMDIFSVQTAGLTKRISTTGSKMVVGVSGGLDSTLALLVCANAARKLKKEKSVIGITMPCFGTSKRTYNNALKLMNALGIESKEINIKDACIAHFEDIGHDINDHDLTYENAQARERTQVLMDYAGKVGGMVIGTGDLSELALGWCTYNGDHMSMYAVNSGVPKTLIKYIIESIIESNIFPDANEVLADIIATPISPELLPPDESGKITQQTEDIVGPYELHDFYIYYTLRYGFSPEKIYHLAKQAFVGVYENEVILKWLKSFYKRFFSQQFKRSCMSDGIKVLDIGLSPRGDFKMPSDAVVSLWLDEVEKILI